MTISRKLFDICQNFFQNITHSSFWCEYAVTVTGKRENKRRNELELPCKVTVKAPFFICSKVETIIRDLCSRKSH